MTAIAVFCISSSLAANGQVGLRFINRDLHDGRATTLEQAFAAHDGQAAASRDGFAALAADAKAQVLTFLHSF